MATDPRSLNPTHADSPRAASLPPHRTVAVRLSISPYAQSLRLITQFRAVAVPIELFLVWLGSMHLELVFDHRTVLMLIGLHAAIGVVTWLYHRQTDLLERPVTAREVLVQVHLDIVAMAAVLYLTGGTTNPLAPLLLLPLVAAAALPRRWIWATALTTVVAYVFLRGHYVALEHPLGPLEVFRLHASGDQISYLICAATLAYFVDKVVGTTRRYERMLADVQERQVRDDSVVAIGAFAAGCAHELATPLSTMDMLIREMKSKPDDAPRRCENLDLLAQQLQLGQGIVRDLTGAAQRHRDGHDRPVTVERFLDDAVERARHLHPMATFLVEATRLGESPHIVPDAALRQALHVLLDNAAQAARTEVHVHAHLQGCELCISVSDDGQGFPAAALQQLGRQRITTKQDRGGNGLGLLLASVTLDRMGGRLRFSNSQAGGAKAQLYVPLQRISPEPATA